MKSLVARLRQDPRVIRWTTLKIGERLEDIASIKTGQTISALPIFFHVPLYKRLYYI